MIDEKPQVLLLDDELEILNSLKRLLRKNYEIHTFTQGSQALDFLSNNDVDVIISDMRMPEMDGADFLAKAFELKPNIVRMLLTGYADMESAVKAINQGKIFNYIHKPWDNEQIQFTLSKAVEHSQLVAEKERLTQNLKARNEEITQLNKTLESKVQQRTEQLLHEKEKLEHAHAQTKKFYRGMVTLLSGISSHTLNQHSGHSTRIANHAQSCITKIKLTRNEKINIYFAGLFHELGKLNLDRKLIKSPFFSLTQEEQTQFLTYCINSSNLLAPFDHLKECSLVIKHLHENINGTGFPSKLLKDKIPLGSRLLRVIIDYDNLIHGFLLPTRLSPDQAKEWILDNEHKYYDLSLAQMYFDWLKVAPTQHPDSDLDFVLSPQQALEILKNQPKVRLVLLHDVTDLHGRVYLTKSNRLDSSNLKQLKEIESKQEVHFVINVAVKSNKIA